MRDSGKLRISYPYGYWIDHPTANVSDIDSEAVQDVRGPLKDLLTHEEEAAKHLEKIREGLDWVVSQINLVNDSDQAQAEAMAEGFLEHAEVSKHAMGIGGIHRLAGDVYTLQDKLAFAINELNSMPSSAEEIKEAFIDDPVDVILTSTMAFGVVLSGTALGAIGGPIGAAAGFGAGAGIGGAFLTEIHSGSDGHFARITQCIADINTITEALGSFSEKIEQGSEWMRAEVAKLDQEQLEDTQEA